MLRHPDSEAGAAPFNLGLFMDDYARGWEDDTIKDLALRTQVQRRVQEENQMPSPVRLKKTESMKKAQRASPWRNFG